MGVTMRGRVGFLIEEQREQKAYFVNSLPAYVQNNDEYTLPELPLFLEDGFHVVRVGKETKKRVRFFVGRPKTNSISSSFSDGRRQETNDFIPLRSFRVHKNWQFDQLMKYFNLTKILNLMV